ncbi:hypothetical protein [Azoarcus olearius]|uniref:Hypothetical secreted protein n=1 Tax=Azoarcus sp. (strain BH72) TaxID=418699 RepID=A1K8L5_AZOSB|nr:hypothetical protein [Azoarcus olearius]CAL95170.1 hypothetical secreted protein [Azoarcus olearius]
MKHNALAIALTLLLSALLGLALWWDYRRNATPHPTPGPASFPIDTRSAARPAPAPTQALPHNGLYRCDGPAGTSYQSHPCTPGSRQGDVSGGTLSTVTVPPPRPLPPPVASVETPTPKVGLIARGPRPGEGNEALCAMHERDIKRIDEAARRGQSSESQEWLREQRRWHKDEMWRLACGR